jgi:hypothetical protein
MEAVVFCGVQGSGKTSLYRDRFLETHVRISMDLLHTRRREEAFLALCLESGQRFVVDNTNPTPTDRRRYVEPARALARNAARPARRRVHVAGVLGTGRRLVRPTLEEGFDELWHATAAPGGAWRVEPLLVTPPLF